jgi:hypothetical protein
MAGAYKVTPTRYLESEIAMPPLDLYFDKWVANFDKWVANFENRIELSGMAQLFRNVGAKVAEIAAGRKKGRRRSEVAQQLTRDSKV